MSTLLVLLCPSALAFPQPLDEVSSLRTSVLTLFLFLLLMYPPVLNKHLVLSLGWRQAYCIKGLPKDSHVIFLLPGFHHCQYFSPTIWRSKIYSNAFFLLCKLNLSFNLIKYYSNLPIFHQCFLHRCIDLREIGRESFL